MPDIQLLDLTPGDFDTAVDIVVQAMRDNPLHVRTLGDDANRRAREVQTIQRALMESVRERGVFIVAKSSGTLVGLLGIAQRKPTLTEAGRLLRPLLAGQSPVVILRVARWFWQWARRQPREPYWHVGPVAVAPAYQRQGVGSALMQALCSRLDACQATAYLETDEEINVRFYRKFEFETIDEADILGVRNWFMLRKPQPREEDRRETEFTFADGT